MSAAARLYLPQHQQTCWHRPPLNGHGTVLVDEDLKVDCDAAQYALKRQLRHRPSKMDCDGAQYALKRRIQHWSSRGDCDGA
jgi:hypothetical protein